MAALRFRPATSRWAPSIRRDTRRAAPPIPLNPMSKLKVLFLCTGNSCRSQMAEGWARHLKADAVDACSAGVEPTRVNPDAVRVMAEAGIDISAQRSKHIDELASESIDFVVAVCDHARESCPVFPGGANVVRHTFDDPPQLAAGA